MDLTHLGIALVAYLTGAVLVYAYVNRNHYLDLLLAIIAAFAYGTSMLLIAFRIIPNITLLLSQFAQTILIVAIAFLAVRIVRGIYVAVKKRLRS
ncbi:MAG TPA: hypothetical protein VE439_01815 [Anaerolineae bacterium]|nr:hypothetical protein [Anaerolineae bacterium]